MRNLFSRNEDGIVEIAQQVWAIAPFEAIRKKYKTNDIADTELTLVWYVADYRSDFLENGDVKDRCANTKLKIFPHRNLKLDDVTYAAIKFYEDNQDTEKINLVKALRNGVEKATTTINLASLSDLEDIKTFSDIVSKLPGLIESLDKVESLVKKEMSIEGKVVGAAIKGVYEDG
jgi:hypothetical protein